MPNREKKTCEQCKKSFVPLALSRGRFCSRACAGISARKKSEVAICPQCNISFDNSLPPCHKKKYCSISCASKYTARKAAPSTCHPALPNRGRGLCHKCYAFENTLRRNYNINTKVWYKVFAKQNGLCPICNKILIKPGDPSGKRAASVDHDHKTGRIRGLLCNLCNRQRVAINTAETAKRMVVYLESDFDARDM